MDHPELKYTVDDLATAHAIKGVMLNVGETARKNDIRLSMHPGPYTCLASPNEDVVAKSLLCLEMPIATVVAWVGVWGLVDKAVDLVQSRAKRCCIYGALLAAAVALAAVQRTMTVCALL